MKTDRLTKIKNIHAKMVHDCKIWDTQNIYTDQIEAQKDLIADAEELAELKQHLQEIAWITDGYEGELYCPACRRSIEEGHFKDCWLYNAIKEEGK